MEQEKKQAIRVRDRRDPNQFSIDTCIIDHWFPIITAKGFALYCLYCRLAGKERSIPHDRMIARQMGMSTNTIANYNKLLVWCGLLHITPGKHNQTNDFYILDVPTVTEESRARIQQAVQNELNRLAVARETEAAQLEQNGLTAQAAAVRRRQPGPFLRGVIKRLHKWRPIQIHFVEEKGHRHPEQPDQLPLFGTDGSGNDGADIKERAGQGAPPPYRLRRTRDG